MKLAKALLLFVVLCVSHFVYAQQLMITDRQTGKAIADVLVFNTSKTHLTLSNTLGNADLSVFSVGDTLVFQHPSYQLKHLVYNQLKTGQLHVLLDEAFVDLNEVVVSANKWEEKKSEVPNKIELIKQREVLFNNPPTSADMLAHSNAVYVQKSQLGGGSPMIRGFAANRILFVVDGIRMNNAIYRSGNLQNILQADVNSIAGTEIIFGPGTNIYGSDALGGVMDFHLLSPALNYEKAWKASGHVYGRLASAAFEKSLHADVNVANNKIAFLTSVSLTDFNNLRMGSSGSNRFKRDEYVVRIENFDSIVTNPNPNIQKNSGYSQLNFMQKLKFNFNTYNSLDFGFYYSGTSDVPRYDRLTQTSHGHLKYASWYYSPQSWMMARAGLTFRKKKKLYDQASFVFAFQHVKEGRNDRKYRNELLRQRLENVSIFSLNAHFDKNIRQGQHLYYGGQWDYNKVNSTGIERNIITDETQVIASRYPDGGSQSHQAGIYLSYKNNFRKIPLSLLTGIRFSLSSLLSTFVDTSFYHLPYTQISINNQSITGNAGLVYRPGQWQLRLNFSSGFRVPDLDDIAKIFDSEPGNVVVPNANLKPETLYNTDFGIKKSFGQKADVEMTLFYSYLLHAMVRRDFQLNGQDSIVYDGQLSKVQAVVNAGYATVYGINFEAEVQLVKKLGFKTSLTYIHGKDDEDKSLRHVPPLYGAWSLFYEQSKLRLEVGAVFNGQITYENLAPSEQEKAYLYALDSDGHPYSPVWWTLNLRGSYAFSEHLLSSLAVENMLDKAYRPYSSGISAPGINIVLALRYSF